MRSQKSDKEEKGKTIWNRCGWKNYGDVAYTSVLSLNQAEHIIHFQSFPLNVEINTEASGSSQVFSTSAL